MPLTTTAAIMSHARRHGVIAFNVVTLEQADGLIAGAEAAERPVILQVSEHCLEFHARGARAFLCGLTELVRQGRALASIHLDHIETPSWLRVGAGTGVSSAMVDASRLSFAENVRTVADLTQMLHADGWYVEAELGEIGGKRGAHASGVRTDPDEAAVFVSATGIDALAVAVGSSHGMSTADATLDDELIAAIADRVSVPLVLHGSSGVSAAGIRQAVAVGITKVNIGTRVATTYSDALRRSFEQNPATDPRPHLRAARDAVSATAVEILSSLTGENGGGRNAL